MKESCEGFTPKQSKFNSYFQRFKTAEQRFWEGVNKNGPTPKHLPHIGKCWSWTKAVCGGGYGRIKIDGKIIPTTHFAWETRHGKMPIGVQALHKCDNPNCVNPSHLFLGTHKDNMRDRELKSRGNHPFGEMCGTSKLTTEQVRLLRSMKWKGRVPKIAKEFGVSNNTIYRVVNNENWNHL